jgi:hypothetical protein
MRYLCSLVLAEYQKFPRSHSVRFAESYSLLMALDFPNLICQSIPMVSELLVTDSYGYLSNSYGFADRTNFSERYASDRYLSLVVSDRLQTVLTIHTGLKWPADSCAPRFFRVDFCAWLKPLTSVISMPS